VGVKDWGVGEGRECGEMWTISRHSGDLIAEGVTMNMFVKVAR
jgi:hypothetical protein